MKPLPTVCPEMYWKAFTKLKNLAFCWWIQDHCKICANMAQVVMGWRFIVHSRTIFMLIWCSKVLEILYFFIDATETKMHPVFCAYCRDLYMTIWEQFLPCNPRSSVQTPEAFALWIQWKLQPHRCGILVLSFLPWNWYKVVKERIWGCKFATWSYACQ